MFQNNLIFIKIIVQHLITYCVYSIETTETQRILKTENNSLSDKELLNLCEKGAEMGYAQLYHRYAKSVFNSVYRLVTDLSEAEDLTQDIFVSIFSDIKKLKEIEQLGAWLTRIAINKSISHLRKKKVYFTDIESANVIDDGEQQLIEKYELDDKIEEIQNAIEALPADIRTIVNLFLFENIPHEEIANMLRISNTTVRSKYHRAKKKIAQSLQQTMYYE